MAWMNEAAGHGKVILFGEHAVVHGCPALALALPRGAVARAEPAAVDRLHVLPFGSEVLAGGPAPTERKQAQLQAAFAAVLADTPAERPAVSVRAELQVAAGAGLGGSAALSVAVIRAVDAALGRTRSEAEIIEASLRWERIYHGDPSGVDSALATCGGVGMFRKGEPLEAVRIPRLPLLVVGHSGEAPETAHMVQSVARQLEHEPDRVGGIFKDIESTVHAGRSALQAANWDEFGRQMLRNQQRLQDLKLSTDRLDEMCNGAMEAGGLGAKLTGGGGGGCMIALAPDRAVADRMAACLSELSKRFEPKHFTDAFVVDASAASATPAR